MRAVVQRVRSASVTVDGRTVGIIGAGLLAFVGVAADDGPGDVKYLATKIRDMRVFEDEQGRMNRSVAEAGGSLLVVSQFTLYGDLRRGRRLSFDLAAPAADGRRLFEDLVRALREGPVPVETGTFQARMSVTLENDGPVTILLDSRRLL